METMYPSTIDAIFEDFVNRRHGSLKALTTESDQFFEQCNPEAENLCLYGNLDATWTVALPAEMVPPELPEPAVGINFARDGMTSRAMWLALVAVHTDSWLLAVAFFHGAKLSRQDKKRLFEKCNELPSLYETITGKEKIVWAPKKLGSSNKRPVGKMGAVASQKNEKGGQNKKAKKEEESEPGVHDSPASGAKKILPSDSQLLSQLKGRHVQLFWPDDNKWYDAEVLDFNQRNKAAKVRYITGDLETLNLDELIVDGHIFVRKQ